MWQQLGQWMVWRIRPQAIWHSQHEVGCSVDARCFSFALWLGLELADCLRLAGDMPAKLHRVVESQMAEWTMRFGMVRISGEKYPWAHVWFQASRP